MYESTMIEDRANYAESTSSQDRTMLSESTA